VGGMLYTDLFRAPFSSYQQALDAAEKTTRQGLEAVEQAIEGFEKAEGPLPLAASGRARK